MKVRIYPSHAFGGILAPPSKSMAHRKLICAGLSCGKSRISGVTLSDDILATLDCLHSLGALTEYDGNTVEITGANPILRKKSVVFPCRECGSTLRFFIPLALCSDAAALMTGSERLLERPLGIYEDICSERGLEFSRSPNGINLGGPLSGGDYSFPGNVSSQFISGLMFALPLLDEDSRIRITSEVESASYIGLTVSALYDAGIKLKFSDRLIEIPGGQSYLPVNTEVEGDYSNAAFFEALNLFGGEVKVSGLRADSLQGDRVYPDLFDTLKSGDGVIDISDCPDLGPVLFAVAAALHGGRFTGTARLRIKESDRSEAMAAELAGFGTKVTVSENDVIIENKEFHPPEGALYGHGDHRIVMALAVLCSLTGGIIDGAEAVSKSMPDFFERLNELGIKTEKYEA